MIRRGDLHGHPSRMGACPTCHAEPQRSISLAGGRDPSLRLRVTVEGSISKSDLFFETTLSAPTNYRVQLRTNQFLHLSQQKAITLLLLLHSLSEQKA